MISDYVDAHANDAISFLQAILRVPSVTGDEEAVAKVFADKMRDAGLEVQVYEAAPHRPNLLAEWFGSVPGKRFVFNGHMDVFPPNEGDPGLYGPWSGELHDGKIYGRGASDMKGGDAGAMMAVLFLREMGFDPKGSILLSWMVDEEKGSALGANYLLEKGLLEGDIGLCMEPTNGDLLIAHGGIIRGHVTYRSVPHHTSQPYPYGANAIEKAVRVMVELYKIRDRLLAVTPPFGFDKPCLSIALFEGGMAANVHPDSARFWFDRRVNIDENHEEALSEIVRVLDAFKARDPAYAYELQITNNRPFLNVPEDHPFVDVCKRSFKAITGRELKMYRRAGGSDGGNINHFNGMAIPNFGAALDYEDSGKPNEKIDVNAYLEFIKVYMMICVNALS